MSLRPLPNGLAPDVVEKLRWEAFAHKRAFRLKSTDDLLHFTQQRGFVLERPTLTLPPCPSALEAVVGRPLLEFTWDERQAQLEAWRDANLRSKRLVLAGFLGHPALFSLASLTDFLAAPVAAAGAPSQRHPHSGRPLTDVAAAICDALASAGPQTDSALRATLGLTRASSAPRYAAALREVAMQRLVVEIDHRAGDGGNEVVHDLTARAFKAQVAKAKALSADVARERLVCRYLRNVLLSPCADVARTFGWEVAETVAVCDALVRKRRLHTHPSSRPNRPIYQASLTDLLDVSASLLPGAAEGPTGNDARDADSNEDEA